MGKDKEYRIDQVADMSIFDTSDGIQTKKFIFSPFPFTGYDFRTLIFTMRRGISKYNANITSSYLHIEGGTTGRYSTGDNPLHDHYVLTLRAGGAPVRDVDAGRFLMTKPHSQEAILESPNFELTEDQFDRVDSVRLLVSGMQQD